MMVLRPLFNIFLQNRLWSCVTLWTLLSTLTPYAAMLAAQDVAARCKELGVTALHIKLRATGKGILKKKHVIVGR